MSTATNEPLNTATIRLLQHFAELSPVIPGVAELFQHDEMAFRSTTRGSRWRRRRQGLRACQLSDGRLLFPARAVDRVVSHLEALGIAVRREDQRRLAGPVQAVDAEVAARLLGPQRQLADAIANHHSGLILSENHAHKLLQLADVSRLFCRSARVLIAVPTRANCQHYVRGLVPYLAGEVDWGDNFACQTATPVAVCTYRQLLVSIPDQWQVLLLPELGSADNSQLQEGWLSMQEHRVYGFAGVRDRGSQRTALTIEMLVGPVIYQPLAAELLPRVRVVYCRADATPSLAAPESPLARKRTKIWHCDRRNDLVAGVARALAAGHREDLWPYGLFLGGNETDQCPLPARTVVIVESLEHGRELLRLLPGWGLVELGTQSASGIRQRVPPQSIVSMAALHRHKLQFVDAVVRADGGAGALDLATLLPSAIASGRREVLLVDVADDFDEQGASATLQRHQDYQGLGCTIDNPNWLSRLIGERHQVPAAARRGRGGNRRPRSEDR